MGNIISKATSTVSNVAGKLLGVEQPQVAAAPTAPTPPTVADVPSAATPNVQAAAMQQRRRERTASGRAATMLSGGGGGAAPTSASIGTSKLLGQ